MLSEESTIAGPCSRARGYMNGAVRQEPSQGDRDEHLPTNERLRRVLRQPLPPERRRRARAPRTIRATSCSPTERRSASSSARVGSFTAQANGDGTQAIEGYGAPHASKRMETVDDDTSDAAVEFIRKAHAAGEPFFVWWNGSRMHFRTHVKAENRGISGQDEYADGMVEHDMHIGKFLDVLDELGIADNTIVFYSTDNGPHMNTWPDAGWNPFRGEKNTNWEGGWRVPAMVRWPGKIEAGTWSNEIVHHMDWLPTFLAAAGEPNIKDQLKAGGVEAIGRSYKVHLDGYNILPLLTGETDESPRKEIFYFSDDGDLTALRYADWKIIFMEQKEMGTFRVWMEPFVPMRTPIIVNLRRDPYERGLITSNSYFDWMLDRAYMYVPAQTYVANFMETFKEFPPRQKAASFSLDQVMEKLVPPGG